MNDEAPLALGKHFLCDISLSFVDMVHCMMRLWMVRFFRATEFTMFL